MAGWADFWSKMISKTSPIDLDRSRSDLADLKIKENHRNPPESADYVFAEFKLPVVYTERKVARVRPARKPVH